VPQALPGAGLGPGGARAAQPAAHEPGMRALRAYTEFVAEHRKNPPAGWDGVRKFETK
jgi:hypothetical protein